MSNPFVQPAGLRGIILRDEEDRVIVQATPKEIEAFAPRRGQAVDVRQANVTMRVRGMRGHPFLAATNVESTGVDASRNPQQAPVDGAGVIDPMGGMLYDAEGRPVALIDSVHVTANHIDVTRFGGTRQMMMAGPASIELGVKVLPGVTLLR